MIDKKTQSDWDRGRRVTEAFPKKLDAETIRRLKAALDAPRDSEAYKEAEIAFHLMQEKVAILTGNFAHFVYAPEVFAATRRDEGDPAAAPSDYDCLCPVQTADGVPACLERKPECKFRGARVAADVNRDKERRRWRCDLKRLILSELSPDRPEELAASLNEMETALRRANERRKRAFGAPFPLAHDAWTA